MTARGYRDALLRHWRLIILLALATGLGAMLASQVMTHRYRSIALVQIVVNPANPSPAAVLAGGNLLTAEIQLATSTPVLQRVTKNYPGLSDAELASEVQALGYNSTSTFLQVIVLDASPSRAASLANDVAAAMVAEQAQTRTQQNTAELQPLQSQLATTEQDIENTTATLASLSSGSADPAEIARQQAHLTDLNTQKSQLETNISQIQVAQALNGFTLRVSQPATPNPNPVRPIVLANVGAGVAFGIIVGMLLVLGWELLSLRAPASKALLASFGWPYLTALQAAADRDGAVQIQTIEVPEDTQPYQRIETALQLGDTARPVRSLVISSLGADESAQHVAAQLAVQLATHGERTLLIDANVEHPHVASWFGIAEQPGLSGAVLAFQTGEQNEQAFVSAIQMPSTLAVPNLRLISAGGPWPHPTRVFRSAAMGRLGEALVASGAQRVLYSAPPLLNAGVARALASRTDGVLLVIDPESLQRKTAQQAHTMLTRAGIQVLGYVIVSKSELLLAQNNAGAPANTEAIARTPPSEVVRARQG